jgi:hypothetical protein
LIWSLVPALIVLGAMAVGLDRSAGYHSDTVDESTYIAASVRLWRKGRDTLNGEQPPLSKWLMGDLLSMVESDVRNGQSNGWTDGLWGHPPERMMRNLRTVRWVSIGWILASGLLLFLFLRKRFGEGPALLALVFAASSPLLFAHGSLATMEAGATFTTTVLFIACFRWAEAPNLFRSLQVLLAALIATLAKMSAFLLIPPGLVGLGMVCFWRSRRNKPWRKELTTLLALLILAGPLGLWAAYGFERTTIPASAFSRGEHRDLAVVFGGPNRIVSFLGKEGKITVPAYDFLSGLGFQIDHSRGGHNNFMDGKVGFDGWPDFFLRSMLYETPLPNLALAFLAIMLALSRPKTHLREWTFLVAPLGLFIYLSFVTKAQAGLKYMMPVLMLWIGFLATVLGRWWQERDPHRPDFRGAVLLGLLTLSLGDVHRHHPHYLMYFNQIAGGPMEGDQHLIHGKDWGQGQRQLAQWQRRNGVFRLWYAKYHGNPSAWGIRSMKPPCRPVLGWVAAHVSEIHRPEWHPPVGCLHWLKALKPVGHFGFGLRLWHVSRADYRALEQKEDGQWIRSVP